MTDFDWKKNTPNVDEKEHGITGESALYKGIKLTVSFIHNDYEGDSPKFIWNLSVKKSNSTLRAFGEVVMDVWDGEEITKEQLQSALSLAKKRAEDVAVCFAECKMD